ncbi:MAG: amino acid adenylation domain-containing protein [Methylococcales bacterium]|nr:amino acid adenylation domain-containing protein [Methylococcales bacterium]
MSLLSSFYQQCNNTPDTIAFIEANQQISYRQVYHFISKICILLTSKNAHCQRVVIALDRGIDAAVSLLAVLNSGACYIPLDLKNPHSRLNYIINDVDCQCIIGKGSCPEWVDQPQLWLDINQLPSIINYQPKKVLPESLAAILYTSGSTGNPKGVALSHKAMSNFSDWAISTFNVTKNDRVASLAPFYFDLSVFDIFSSLSCGATVHFVPTTLTFSPSRLTSWLGDHKITIWYTVPSILSFIALKGALASTPLPNLKTILFAGEVFPTPQLMNFYDQLPEINFYNLYGPTETNVCCYWKVNRKKLVSGQPIPIGYPACNSVLAIDPNNSELKVQSNNNLSGYWQGGKLIPALSSENFYHTGDKVTLNEQGEYCYHGRLDRMLKCSGYRVEPAEIEHAILQLPQVKNCAVIGIKDNTSGQRPAAAIVLKNKATLADIIKPIKQKLPSYMLPYKFIELKSLPHLANGKTDYQTLQRQIESK